MKTGSPGCEARAGRRIVVHPLFLAAGVAAAFTGQFLYFVSAGVAALEHELAHAFAARRYGYSLDKVVLMPYGAVVSGDLSGITRRQEVAVCLAGPLANLATAFFFVALWWLYPECYPYTEAAARVSLSLFLVNLLPAYPLDGGRVLGALLRPLGARRVRRVLLLVTALIALSLLGYFVYSCFFVPNLSALLFAGFLFAGMAGGGRYLRLRVPRRKNFARGLEEQRIALSQECTLGEALRFLREDRLLVLVLYDGEEFAGELTERELMDALAAGDYSAPLKRFLPALS